MWVRRRGGALALFLSSVSPLVARAQPTEPTPSGLDSQQLDVAVPPASATPGVPPPPGQAPPLPPAYSRWIVTTELLGALAGRYGAQIEYAFTARDSVTLYGWYLAAESRGTATLIEGDPSYEYDTSTRAGGIDAQYRRYIGSEKGAMGGFIAPGLEYHDYVAQTSQDCASAYGYNNPGSSGCPQQPPPHHEAFSYLGGTLDVGGQAILPVGLVVGGSFGLHYRKVVAGELDDIKRPWSWSISHGDGLRPRLRFWLGWAF